MVSIKTLFGEQEKSVVNSSMRTISLTPVPIRGIDNLNQPFNIGAVMDYSTRELAELFVYVIGYQGEILWDSSKSGGAPRKMLDSSRMLSTGWQAYTDFTNSVRETYEWIKRHVTV